MTTTYLSLSIRPALATPARPTWRDSVWVGEIWRDTVESFEQESSATGLPVRCTLGNAEGYRRARLLVRSPGRTHGFVDIDVHEGHVDFDALRHRVVTAVGPAEPGVPPSWLAQRRGRPRSVTVVICTRDRPNLLAIALESVLALDFPDFDVVVVDNAPTTAATSNHVVGLRDPRVTLVAEPSPGLSRARNAGLHAAGGELVAYVDDDTVVDRHWLTALVAGFDRCASVSCVSGMVPAGEIRTPAQAEFDRRVNWSNASAIRVFDWDFPPRDIPLFPFAAGEYGTGANFALDREVAMALGGFDEHLGAGSATRGGEDLDMFFRILRSGRQIVHDPAAIVWHRHRDNDDELHTQIRSYGMGLGAWLAKVASDPATAWLALRTAVTRAPALVRHLRTPSHQVAPGVVLRGAWEYRRGRKALENNQTTAT